MCSETEDFFVGEPLSLTKGIVESMERETVNLRQTTLCIFTLRWRHVKEVPLLSTHICLVTVRTYLPSRLVGIQ